MRLSLFSSNKPQTNISFSSSFFLRTLVLLNRNTNSFSLLVFYLLLIFLALFFPLFNFNHKKQDPFLNNNKNQTRNIMIRRNPFSHTQFPDVSPETPPKLEKVVFVSSFPPRKCGIATFCFDLLNAVADNHQDLKCYAVALNDQSEGYDYDREVVRFEISEDDTASYMRAADYINAANVSVVVVQHEYGLYGSQSGSKLLHFMRSLRVPIVTTCHTILAEPNIEQKRILSQIISLSTRVVTMAQKGLDLLTSVYQADTDKLDIIEHGIPYTPTLLNKEEMKKKIGMEGHLVVLTFGLLSPGKGLEHAIAACPAIKEKHPNFRYIILGATHPGIVKNHGEAYRNSLIHQAEDLGVSENVVFVDKFVDLELLKVYLGACDTYLMPYLSRDQITSGTAAYATAIGNVVVSTPFWHAQELLKDGRGFLVPFRDSEKMAETVNMVLSDPKLRQEIIQKTFDYGRSMTWPATSNKYRQTFQRAMQEFIDFNNRTPTTPTSKSEQALFIPENVKHTRLPKINLDHLIRMTDDVGIIQHAHFAIPAREHGYSIDDVARSLNFLTQIKRFEIEIPDRVKSFSEIYMAYLWHAYIPDKKRFHNFMSFDRKWLDDVGSEDSHGRTLQALAAGVRFGNCVDAANELFLHTMHVTRGFTSPRAWAYSLIGFRDYVAATNHHEARDLMNVLAGKLKDMFKKVAKDKEWPWPEEIATYDNSILPQALIVVGRLICDDEMQDLGESALKWLFNQQISNDGKIFSPIGNLGWMKKNGERANWDQQSLEPGGMTLSCISAWHATQDDAWYHRARIAFDWYMGKNTLGISVYDPISGGCQDALHEFRVNKNQGAESLLMFLLGLAAVKNAERERGDVDNTSRLS